MYSRFCIAFEVLFVSVLLELLSKLKHNDCKNVQCESKKIPSRVFWKFFPNGWEFLINFLHTYYAIIYTLEYEFLFKYLQLWQSYAILSATT